MTVHTPPPVSGYQPISQAKLDLVNANKETEEQILRLLDQMGNFDLAAFKPDHRWVAIARTHFEQAFMALNRSIFQPQRIALPGDEKTEA